MVTGIIDIWSGGRGEEICILTKMSSKEAWGAIFLFEVIVSTTCVVV